MAGHADASQEELRATDLLATSAASPNLSKEASAESPSEAASSQANSETSAVQPEDVDDYDAAVDADVDDDPRDAAIAQKRISPVRLAMALGVVMVLALTALAGWLGFRGYQAHQAQQQRELFVRVARQGALNLTTINWQHADADIQRILDSATGTFYDDFSTRSKPFIDVVKKAQSKSVGTITEAGLESESGNEAQVLVALSVNTSNLSAAEQEPRHWRMRISVQKVGDEAKVSNVAFVP
ncbi:Mce protein [Mycobacterium xenopi]|uniref:Mce protein n=1 Tax=Mycobacterium xenopi TaxID=1789 RepID=UPI0022EB2D15|nr:Mce protein [Mycobacterium xenopi]MDA3657827.1 Mce protein [Mycobacterium xenopi]